MTPGATRGMTSSRGTPMRAWFTAAGRIASWVVVLSIGSVPGARAQPAVPVGDPDELIKRLVVRIDTDVDYGAGIIVGADAGTLYIATANHVVRRGGRDAGRIDVQFRGRTAPAVPARLLGERDEQLDLAVLSVTVQDGAFDPRAVPFDRLGDPQALARGDAIFLLGHPNGLPWRINTAPERFIERRDASIDFESNLIAKGHSGGALLSEHRELLGMLKSDQPPYGEAVSIYAIARTIAAWGYPVALQLPAARVSAGDGRTCLLTPRGEIRCWGFDDRFESGPLEADGYRLKSLSTGTDHMCGIGARGAALCVGNNSDGQLGDGTTVHRYIAPAIVGGGLVFVSLSAGHGHTCGVVEDGDVYCWGIGERGQLGTYAPEGSPSPMPVPSVERFTSVAAGHHYSCALTRAGRAHCWGPIDGAGILPNTLAVPLAPDVALVALTTGFDHVCGITGSGDVLCWGSNENGELGDGSSSDRAAHEGTRVSGGLTFASVSAGIGHTCGVTTEGVAYCWGLNNFGQLGNGSKTESAVPVRVSGGLLFESVDAGNLHTCGVTREGGVFCWGENDFRDVHPSEESEHLVPWQVLEVAPGDRVPWREPR
jgi:alpha-tubulin suppressor-like RCC1 family protein